MNVKFLNPFVEAAKDVVRAEINTEVERGNLALQKSALTTSELTVLISLVGQVQGVVLYGLDIDTGVRMVSRVLKQEFDEFNDLAQSGVGELANVISGRATVLLSDAGFETNISPPTLIRGKGVKISTLDFDRVVVPLKTELGVITAHLALRESPPGTTAANFVELAAIQA